MAEIQKKKTTQKRSTQVAGRKARSAKSVGRKITKTAPRNSAVAKKIEAAEKNSAKKIVKVIPEDKSETKKVEIIKPAEKVTNAPKKTTIIKVEEVLEEPKVAGAMVAEVEETAEVEEIKVEEPKTIRVPEPTRKPDPIVTPRPIERSIERPIEKPLEKFTEKFVVRPGEMPRQKEAARPKRAKRSSRHTTRMPRFGFRRVLIALACAAAAVFAIVYFVNLNTPNIDLGIAAMQAGINCGVQPKYIPRGYNLSSFTAEAGKIVIYYANSEDSGAFSLTLENSAWDSNALYSNYVRDTYGDNYTAIREQGLTLYVSGSNAAWVNGGILYKLKTTSGTLTKKQITTIAANLYC